VLSFTCVCENFPPLFTLLPKDKINYQQETRSFLRFLQYFFLAFFPFFALHMIFIKILSCDIILQKEEKTVLKLSYIVFDQKRVKMLSKLENFILLL